MTSTPRIHSNVNHNIVVVIVKNNFSRRKNFELNWYILIKHWVWSQVKKLKLNSIRNFQKLFISRAI